MGENKTSTWFVPIIMIGIIVSGSVNSLVGKMQDNTIDDFTGREFFHPYFQTLIMFISEFGCLVAFYISLNTKDFKAELEKGRSDAVAKGLKGEIPTWVPLLPACCDITATTLQLAALTMMDPSIYVMIRGGIPITTAIFSVIFLKRKLYNHHVFGLSLVVVGISLVGYCQVINQTDDEQSSNAVLGLILSLMSLIGTAAQFIIEEKIFNKYYVHPLKMVGLEGFWGLFLSGAVITIASYIPCDPAASYCNMGYFENPQNAIHDILHHNDLLFYIILGMISLGFLNFFGVSCTKYVSSLARSVVMITVPVVVWVYSLLFMDGKFYWLQLLGFIILVTGNFIYQEVLEIPGMNQNTKKAIAKRQQLLESQANDDKDDASSDSEPTSQV
jgi:Permeases of the drug/metabolite transporter (DMT) superfamily